MIIIDERNFIRKELEEQGLNVFDFYDGHHLYSVDDFCKLPLSRRSDVLLVDTQSVLSKPNLLESCKAVMNTFHGVIFFHEEVNQEASRWVEEQASFLSKILGSFSLPMSALNWSILANQLQFFWTLMQEQKVLQRHMAEFSQELDQVLQDAESEMVRAKKIHETLIPKRSEEIKGIHFFNKYATGDGGAGEFYDLLQTPGKVYQILVSSESYLISSSLIGLINSSKKSEFNPTAFLNDAEADIHTINSSKKKKAKVEILVLELDLTQLLLKSWGKSKVEIYSQLKQKRELEAGDTIHLARGEKLIVFSPGFLFNWREGNQQQDIYSFINNHQGLSQQELMTELFFQIKQMEGEFLKKDATIVMMEVNRHGMHQV